MRQVLSGFLGFVLILASVGLVHSADLHAGYYYPTPQTQEVFVARVPKSENVSKESRTAFTVGLEKQLQMRGYAPSYHLFPKGQYDEKLIIVVVDSSKYNTLYRMRALIASLTSLVRSTPIFNEVEDPTDLTFLDFSKLMGFKWVTITDGANFAHRYIIE
ncbi:hypothetical protein [Coralliovum pocilloporae]|uniref:hypothetical protein n=1 Tax=Coralliovum pocilloporae TaxID=3066369 RepID=UPI003306E43F